ncbi:MAG: GAF domain-containing protein [Deltaproteobacteria bacterium]|nr:GAF domain-containing protein [Deltaproteobacteria bacterium]
MDKSIIEFELLRDILKISNSTLDLHERLNQVVEEIVEKMHFDACAIYLMRRNRACLTMKAAVGLNPESINEISLNVGEGITGWVAAEKSPVAIRDIRQDDRRRDFPGCGEEKYCSMISAPILYLGKCLGVIDVWTIEARAFTENEIHLLFSIADGISGSVRNAQLYLDVSKQYEELVALYDLGRALTSTLEFQELIGLMTRKSSELIGAGGAILHLLDDEDRMLKVKSMYGLYPDPDLISRTMVPLGEGVTGCVARDGSPCMINDPDRSEMNLLPSERLFASILCVPLIVKERVIGTLSLHEKTDAAGTFVPFHQDDLHLLMAVANQGAMVVENARNFERAERLRRENTKRANDFAILYEISNAMNTTMNLDQLLQIILKAVTFGGGLNFNRAVLLLVNEKTNTLQGMLGVGPDSGEDAYRIWSEIGAKNMSFKEWISSVGFSVEGRGSRFDQLAKGIRVPVEYGQGIMVLTVLERKGFNIKNAWEDPRTNPEILETMGFESFATVPLISQDRVVGVIIVDNLYNKREITNEDLRRLELFANQAGLAIENARVYSDLEYANRSLTELQDRLIQSEKMAALGEMAASIAHEIRNPLVSIGGFARRLDGKLDPENPQKRYSRIIVKEVARLEKVLQEVLAFSRSAEPVFQECDVAEVLSDGLEVLEEGLIDCGIRVVRKIGKNIPKVHGDANQIKQIFINLLSNAQQAMSQGGTLTVECVCDETEGAVVISVQDTGGGIPEDVITNIFNPFFTTKHTGTGLGLAITHRVVEMHGGNIQVKNDPGVGVTFLVTLPAKVGEEREGPSLKLSARERGST